MAEARAGQSEGEKLRCDIGITLQTKLWSLSTEKIGQIYLLIFTLPSNIRILEPSPPQSYLCLSIEFFWTMSNSDLSVAVPSWWDCRTSRTPAGTWTATTESEYCQKWSNSQWGGTFEARHGWPHRSVILDGTMIDLSCLWCIRESFDLETSCYWGNRRLATMSNKNLQVSCWYIWSQKWPFVLC